MNETNIQNILNKGICVSDADYDIDTSDVEVTKFAYSSYNGVYDVDLDDTNIRLESIEGVDVHDLIAYDKDNLEALLRNTQGGLDINEVEKAVIEVLQQCVMLKAVVSPHGTATLESYSAVDIANKVIHALKEGTSHE